MQHLQPGTTLQGGKYRIERILGQGGFGITYLATQISLNRYVAIKELFIGGSGQAINDRRGNQVVVTNSANQASFNQQKEKFKKEALRLANLNHPNLVKVHDLFEENGTAYYVMEYIDGESLRTKLNREGCMSESLVLKYIEELIPALDVAHKQKIWHLDIKPENIMVDKRDHVYLIDFGASKHIEQEGALTTSLVLAYTRGYCPPELADLTYESKEDLIQALKEIGPWTDIYALGASMYNLLTDSIPPSSNRLYKDGSNAFMFPSNVSSYTQNMIVWMMKPNREDRPQRACDVLKDENNIEETICEGNMDEDEDLIAFKEEDYMMAHDADTYQRAKTGRADAQFSVGIRLIKLGLKLHGPASFCFGLSWLEKSAEQQYKPSINTIIELAVQKTKGFQGVYYEPSTNDALYAKAETGNANAQYFVGLNYLHGINGYEYNHNIAHLWFAKAASKGDKRALKKLIEFLRNGGWNIKYAGTLTPNYSSTLLSQRDSFYKPNFIILDSKNESNKSDTTLFNINNVLPLYFNTNNITIEDYDIVDYNLLDSLYMKYKHQLQNEEKIYIEDISKEMEKPIGTILIYIGWLMKEGKVDDNWNLYVEHSMTHMYPELAGYSAGDVYQALAGFGPQNIEELCKLTQTLTQTSLEATLLGLGWLMKEGKLFFENALIKLA